MVLGANFNVVLERWFSSVMNAMINVIKNSTMEIIIVQPMSVPNNVEINVSKKFINICLMFNL